MARAFAGGAVAATTIMNFIVNICSIGLRFAQLCIDFESNGATEIVFGNFLPIDRSVTCFKLFISVYRQVHAEGVGMFALSCLIGLSIHLFTIVIHLYMNHKSRATAWISGLAILVTAGAFMLLMNIPDDYAWHNTTVEAILDLFICFDDAVLLVRSKMSELGGNANFRRDLIMIAVETIINICLFADYLVKTHSSPPDAEKILHVYGSCLSMVIGLGQIGWITYKAYTNRVLAGGEEQAAGAAVDGDGGGDIEQQMVREGAEVVEQGDSKTPRVILLFGKTPQVFSREIEMVAGAAIEDDGGGDEGEEVPAEQGIEAAVTPPA